MAMATGYGPRDDGESFPLSHRLSGPGALFTSIKLTKMEWCLGGTQWQEVDHVHRYGASLG